MKNTVILRVIKELTILELNDSQNLNPKKSKTSIIQLPKWQLEIIGVLKLPSFREGFLIVFCFVFIIILLQFNLFPRTLRF